MIGFSCTSFKLSKWISFRCQTGLAALQPNLESSSQTPAVTQYFREGFSISILVHVREDIAPPMIYFASPTDLANFRYVDREFSLLAVNDRTVPM